MSDPFLPALRTNLSNEALTTTVYAPRQRHELELLPRFHKYAYQEPLSPSQTTGQATTAATWTGDDSSFPSTRTQLKGPVSTSVQLFRPHQGEQQAAVTAARQAFHRYRVPPAHTGKIAAIAAATSPGAGEDPSVSSTGGPATPTSLYPSFCVTSAPHALRGTEPRNSLVDASPRAGSPCSNSTSDPNAWHSPRSRRGDSADTHGCGCPRQLPAIPSRAQRMVDAALRALQPNEIVVPYLCEQRQAALASTKGEQVHSEAIPPRALEALEAETRPEAAADPNTDAVMRLFARQGSSDSPSDPSDDDEEENEQSTETPLPPLPSATIAADGGGGARPLPAGPPTRMDALVARRFAPPHVATRSTTVRATAAGNEACGALVPSSPRQMTRHLSALRWLLYDEQYQRLLLQQEADTASPVPWLLDRNLGNAAAGGLLPSLSRCTLHKMEFTGDADMHAAVDRAMRAYRERLRDHRAVLSKAEQDQELRKREALRAETNEAAVTSRHGKEQEAVWREAVAGKEEAFEASLQFRAAIAGRLALVEDEKRARLALLGEFASCSWPEPCRCLQWDAMVLEDSAIPLSPKLSPVCVYVSVVLGQYAELQDELLAARAADLQRMQEWQELHFMALYVFERLAMDEARVFASTVAFHEYCMAVAANKGERVSSRYTELSPFSVFEKRTVTGFTSEDVVAALAAALAAATAAANQTDTQQQQQGGAWLSDTTADASRSVEGEALMTSQNNLPSDTPHDAHALAYNNDNVAKPPAPAPAPRFIGPRDSPYCSLLTFIDLYAVQSAAVDGCTALAREEARVRHSMEQRLALLRAAAALECDELASRQADIVSPEEEERSRMLASRDAGAACVRVSLEERRRRERLLASICAAMVGLERLAQAEHTARIADCLEAFQAVHQEEARARRWALLRARQRSEGNGERVAIQWVFDREVDMVVSRENTFRQRLFCAEVAERCQLHDAIRLTERAFLARDEICRDEDAAFAVLLVDGEETQSRLRLQHTYAMEQRTLFGKVATFGPADEEGEEEEDGRGNAEGVPSPLHLASRGEAHRSGEDGGQSKGHEAHLPTPVQSPSSPPLFGRRRRPTVMNVYADLPCHPLDGAIAMQRTAVYGLHGYLPTNELLDLFSS